MNTYDVIVVGSGLAGLVTIVNLLKQMSLMSDKSLKILLLEKENSLGGNSAKATSGINLINTPVQFAEEIFDSATSFYEDTSKSSKNLAYSPDLQKQLTDYEINKQVQILFNECGIQLLDVIKCGGHSVPRTHRVSFGKKPADQVRNTGWELISAMTSFIETNEKTKLVTIKKNYRVTQVLFDTNMQRVNGVVCAVGDNSVETFFAEKGVVITSGGFSANVNMIDKILDGSSPYKVNHHITATTNGTFATGDLLNICQKIGAKLVDLEYIQIHPTSFVDPKFPDTQHKFLAPEAFRGLGGILLDEKTGQRFVDELATRDVVTDKILHLENKTALLLINQQMVDKFGSHLIKFYLSKGLISKVDTNQLQQLDISALLPTPAIYLMKVTPTIHYTMGGLLINKFGQVLNTDEQPICGLFAAGEASGGLHGVNRLAGNSLLECVVFGLIVSNFIVNG